MSIERASPPFLFPSWLTMCTFLNMHILTYLLKSSTRKFHLGDLESAVISPSGAWSKIKWIALQMRPGDNDSDYFLESLISIFNKNFRLRGWDSLEYGSATSQGAPPLIQMKGLLACAKSPGCKHVITHFKHKTHILCWRFFVVLMQYFRISATYRTRGTCTLQSKSARKHFPQWYRTK